MIQEEEAISLRLLLDIPIATPLPITSSPSSVSEMQLLSVVVGTLALASQVAVATPLDKEYPSKGSKGIVLSPPAKHYIQCLKQRGVSLCVSFAQHIRGPLDSALTVFMI